MIIFRCRAEVLRPPSAHLLVIAAYPTGSDHHSSWNSNELATFRLDEAPRLRCQPPDGVVYPVTWSPVKITRQLMAKWRQKLIVAVRALTNGSEMPVPVPHHVEAGTELPGPRE